MEVQLSGILSSAAGGITSVEVTGTTVGELLTCLEQRYPAMGPLIEQGIAVAVNGEIYRDRRDQPIPLDAEVYLLPRLAGG